MTTPRSTRCGVCVAALAALVLSASVAQADTAPFGIRFFACEAGSPAAKSVPSNTQLYLAQGWSEGTYGLVRASIPKVVNTFTLTHSGSAPVTINPAFQPIMPNADGTWTAPFQVDLGSLQAGESLTIHWTGIYTGPIEEVIPPSDPWDPAANFQPPWDGTGLKYQNHIDPGPYDNGTCTITAT
jgi:hypothetical protein